MAIKMNGDCQFKLIWIHFNIVTVSWYWTIIWVTFDCIQLLMIYLYLVYRWMRGLCNICSCLIDVVSFCFWSFSIMYRIKFINLCHHIIQKKRNIWIWGSIWRRKLLYILHRFFVHNIQRWKNIPSKFSTPYKWHN